MNIGEYKRIIIIITVIAVLYYSYHYYCVKKWIIYCPSMIYHIQQPDRITSIDMTKKERRMTSSAIYLRTKKDSRRE